MPELPEVELAARRLRAAALGHTLARVEVRHPAIAKHLPPAAVEALIGRTLASVERRAKIQLLHLDDGSVLEVHFRMTGDWDLGDAEDEPARFERLRLHTTDGGRVSLVDPRALGVVRWHAPGTFASPPLGPEPLTEHFTVESLRDALARRRAPIKPVLLDQQVVSGVGNIYASEALWVARIHPRTVANTLGAVRVRRLRDAIRSVLASAPAARYYNRDETPDADSDEWQVYGRGGEPCRRCNTRITRMVQAGRSTFFCRRCQR